MKTNRIALAAALILGIASQAFAAPPSGGLAAGGRTLAGPGTANIAINGTETVYTDGSGNSNACATLVNSGKSAVRLTMVGSGSPSIDVAAGNSAALCNGSLQRMDLVCLGLSSCTAQWRADRD